MSRIRFGCGWLVVGLLACSNPGENLGNECPEIFEIRPNSPAQGGAGGAGGAGGGTSAPPTFVVDVASCAGAATAAEIDDNLLMVRTLSTDFDHMWKCGGYGAGFIYSLTHLFAGLACNQKVDPILVAYAGVGLYQVNDVMSVQLKLVENSALGNAGDDVPFDLFSPFTYFDAATFKAQINANASWNTNGDFAAHVEGTLEMNLEGPKPEALALWNLPADGKNIKVLQESLAKAIGEHVAFSAEFEVASIEAPYIYRIVTPFQTIGEIYRGEMMEMPVTSIDATRPDIQQSASVLLWDVRMVPMNGFPLDGTIVLKMDGGYFPYYVRYRYPKRTQPDILISCTPPAP